MVNRGKTVPNVLDKRQMADTYYVEDPIVLVREISMLPYTGQMPMAHYYGQRPTAVPAMTRDFMFVQTVRHWSFVGIR